MICDLDLHPFLIDFDLKLRNLHIISQTTWSYIAALHSVTDSLGPNTRAYQTVAQPQNNLAYTSTVMLLNSDF